MAISHQRAWELSRWSVHEAEGLSHSMLALEDSWGAILEAVKFLSFQALLSDHYQKWGTSQWVGSSHVIQCKQGYSPTGMPRGQSDLQNPSLRLPLHDSRLYKVDGFKTTHFTISSSHKPSLTAQACDLPLLWTLKGALGSLVSEVYSGCDESLGGFQNKNPYDKSCTLKRLCQVGTVAWVWIYFSM